MAYNILYLSYCAVFGFNVGCALHGNIVNAIVSLIMLPGLVNLTRGNR